ncbi:receptor-like protein 9DC3 isoform X2 [Quercus robur]|uniref:receptor-like protein 9DC3 isoform X2 n=1 Tax=Quercus robur TaxID=38942 RepID=UPI0021615BA4|nr:receptor-like protein 9DC3 isoform X2 [Quercus robur]XP_050279534.1 receptor-like protein 9DC3 isoform X2 [Quercus robur]
MGRSTWKYQVFFLFCLILHSQLPFPSSLSSSLSSMPPCSALLHFSKSFSLDKSASAYDPSYPKTASWQEDKHCCTWDGVECDKNKSHVVGLDLTSSWLMGHFHSNSTLFFLPNLRRLNLADNNFNFSRIPSEIGNFKSLTHLNLSNSVFSGQIPFEISQLSSLVSLALSWNELLIETPVWKRVIGNLTQLRELILDRTNMSSIRPNSLMNLSSSLTTLSLRYCDLRGKLENNILFLPSIQTLDLSDNSFNGLLPSSLFNLPNLSTLDLRYNQLVGPLPNHVSGLNLVDLYLSSNFLNGTLPSWLFSMPSLETLYLNRNQFVGEIGEFKYNSLKDLDLGYNKLHGSIPRSVSRLVNLTSLSLSSNNLSIMLGSEMFSKLKNLETFDLSKNSVSINNNVAYALPNLQYLNLAYSNISEFPIFLRLTTNLQSLDLSNNQIYGRVPRWLGDVGKNSFNYVDLRNNLLQGPFPILNSSNLQFIFFSNNNLTGEIPSLICDAIYLRVLDLSHNNLRGMIPKCLVNFTALSVLDLRMNSIHGTIPTIFAKGNNFRNINLNGNQLEGPLPQSLVSCTDLEVLDLGNNKINGAFPYWLGSLQKLQVLVIRSNRFQGRIRNPKTKFPFPNLRIIDISNNQFNGPLPITYFEYLKAMMNVDESGVARSYMGDSYYQDSLNIMMKGQYIEMERVLTILTSIDFSNNSFGGEMPKIIGRFKSLKGLNFSYNNLIGYIPSSIGNLTNLEWLDLSFNKLGGEIPSQLVDLTTLEVLKLSHNQLTGHIPSGNQFNTFNNDSYTENLGLCGFPLSRTCDNHEAKQPPPPTLQQDENLEHENGFGWQAVSIGYACGTIFGTFVGYLMFKIGKPKCLVRMVKLEQHIMLRRLKKNGHKRGGRR